jgi:sugar-specific transcriptional regulator TrmB
MSRKLKNFNVLQLDNKYNNIKRDYSFYELWELYPNTKVDGQFQRWGGVERGSGWSHKQARAWLSNALVGSTINTIVIAKVSACLKFAREQKCAESIKYWEGVAEDGFENVSMDGNNSTSTVYHFINNHPQIYLMIDNKKTYFKDLPEGVQNKIQNRQRITVNEFREILVDEMCEEFRNFNTSCGLNAQEYRQAQWSDMSAFIMTISNTDKLRQMFKKMVASCSDDVKLDLRTHEELVAQLAMKIQGKYKVDVKKTDLDEFYVSVRDLAPPVSKKIEKVLGTLEKMSAGFKTTGSSNGNKLSKGAFQNLADLIYSILYDFDIDVVDNEQLYEWFDKKDYKFKEDSKQVVEEDREELSYIYWTTTYNKQRYYNKIKEKFAQHFYEDLESLEEKGVVKRRRTSKDIFTPKQKRQLLELQGYETRRKQPITIYDLANGRVEADHLVSFKDGGKTTIENGELMLTADNRKKGAASWLPHFPHQKAPEPDKEIIMMTSEG